MHLMRKWIAFAWWNERGLLISILAREAVFTYACKLAGGSQTQLQRPGGVWAVGFNLICRFAVTNYCEETRWRVQLVYVELCSCTSEDASAPATSRSCLVWLDAHFFCFCCPRVSRMLRLQCECAATSTTMHCKLKLLRLVRGFGCLSLGERKM